MVAVVCPEDSKETLYILPPGRRGTGQLPTRLVHGWPAADTALALYYMLWHRSSVSSPRRCLPRPHTWWFQRWAFRSPCQCPFIKPYKKRVDATLKTPGLSRAIKDLRGSGSFLRPGSALEVTKHKQGVWKFILSPSENQVFFLYLTQVQKHRIVILTPNGLFRLTCYFLLGFL